MFIQIISYSSLKLLTCFLNLKTCLKTVNNIKLFKYLTNLNSYNLYTSNSYKINLSFNKL